MKGKRKEENEGTPNQNHAPCGWKVAGFCCYSVQCCAPTQGNPGPLLALMETQTSQGSSEEIQAPWLSQARPQCSWE